MRERSPRSSGPPMMRWLVCAGAAWLGLQSGGEAAATAAVWRVEHQGVTVEVQVVDADQTEDIFGVDLLAKGVQPLLVKIHNESQHTYQFKKSQVDASYIPAAEAAKHAYDNPVVVGGQVVGRTLLFIPRWIVRSHSAPQDRPLLNKEIQASFLSEEISDRDLAPHSALAGFMYVHPRAADARVTVTLIDLATQTPLVFDAPPPAQP